MKRQVPLLITFIAGAVMILQFYTRPLSWLGDLFNDFFNILLAFAYVLGAASLIISNGHKIKCQAPGWGYNAVLLLSLMVTLFCGFFLFPAQGLPIDAGTAFDWIFQHIYTPMSAATYSLLAFYMASAAFRAFKMRSTEATLLLISAFIVILFRVPLGECIWNHLPFLSQIPIGDVIERWIMNTFNATGQRAIMLGAAVGLISISLKILMGIERSYLGSSD